MKTFTRQTFYCPKAVVSYKTFEIITQIHHRFSLTRLTRLFKVNSLTKSTFSSTFYTKYFPSKKFGIQSFTLIFAQEQFHKIEEHVTKCHRHTTINLLRKKMILALSYAQFKMIECFLITYILLIAVKKDFGHQTHLCG